MTGMSNIQQTGIPGLRGSFTEPTQSAYPLLKTRAKITLHRIALRLWPKRLGRPAMMINLACILYTRFVLELCPQGHPGRARSLGNLACFLHARFKQLGTLPDLEEALALGRNVLERCPQGHPYQAGSLGDLARSLHARFQQLGTLPDLEEALALGHNVLELCPQGHPN